MSSLLDWLLGPERRFNWRYALRIALITSAFQAISLFIVAIVDTAAHYLPGLYFKEIVIVMIPVLVRQFGLVIPTQVITGVGLIVPAYWAVFALAALSDETNPVHRRRIWLAWLLVTFPFAAVYLVSLFNRIALPASAQAYSLSLMMAISPLVTLAAIGADYLVRRCFRWLRPDDHTRPLSSLQHHDQ